MKYAETVKLRELCKEKLWCASPGSFGRCWGKLLGCLRGCSLGAATCLEDIVRDLLQVVVQLGELGDGVLQ